jgi:BirA family biotin operon repressor/biotin-[acetyl-CoA-carboxylase] ligase
MADDRAILTLLKKKDFVSGEDIADSLRISRAAVHKRIAKLRKQGYAITGHRNLGYSLAAAADVLTADEIGSHVPGGKTLSKIYCYTKVPSTQLIARDMAETGAENGTLVVAETQTAGYGRFHRPWSSGQGGIWLSLILKPELAPEQIPQLNLITSLAVSRVLEKVCAVCPGIKWPNDVQLDGKKVAGILIELSAEIDRVNWVVVGIGIDVNNELPSELAETATTLREYLGHSVDRPPLVAALALELMKDHQLFCAHGFNYFSEEYNQRLMLKGKTIEVNHGGRVTVGVAESVDHNGFLIMRLSGGKMERIIAGDVTVKKSSHRSNH